MSNYLKCIKCGTPKQDNASECPFCGVIYAKAEAVYEKDHSAVHNGRSHGMDTGNQIEKCSHGLAKQDVPRWDFYCLLELLFVFAVPLFGLYIPYNYYEKGTHFPLFEDLIVKKGILTEVRRFVNTSDKSLAGITVTLDIDGQTEKYKMPILQDVKSIGDDLGNEIEIRYNSHPSENKKIWHVSSERREYFKYQEEFERQKEFHRADRNILLLSILATIYFLLANFRETVEFIKNLPEKHSPKPVELPSEMTFIPNTFYPGSFLYLLFIIALKALYYGIFFYPKFLIIGVLCPAIALIWFLRKPPCSITLSKEGIKTETFRKKFGRNFFRWNEIEDIYLRYINKGPFVINLSVRTSNNSKSISIVPTGYLNSILLQDLLVKRYSLE